MFDRVRDPNNLEELMIAEFIANKDKLDDMANKLEEERLEASSQYDELLELFQESEEKVSQLETILRKDEGVVDLHESVLLYKSDIASSYYFKDWLNDHAEDVFEEGTGLDAYMTAAGSSDIECIRWFKDNASGYKSLVKTEQRTFKFTLQVPVFGTFAYDPEYNKTQLFSLDAKYRDDAWVNMPLEEFQKNVAREVRKEASKALKEYNDEQAKKAAEKAES